MMTVEMSVQAFVSVLAFGSVVVGRAEMRPHPKV